jgi:hypothetical protein
LFGEGGAVALQKYKFDATHVECIDNHAAASYRCLDTKRRL